MTFKEFVADPLVSPFAVAWNAKYPQSFLYIQQKYQNYELLYPLDVMMLQFTALLSEYSNILSNIEDAFRIRAKEKNNIDNLGETLKRKKKVLHESEDIDSRNYVGYEVIGEYEKKNGSLNSTNDTDDKQNTYNFLSALTRLETEATRIGWFKFERALVKLFITIYPVFI